MTYFCSGCGRCVKEDDSVWTGDLEGHMDKENNYPWHVECCPAQYHGGNCNRGVQCIKDARFNERVNG